MSEYGWTKIQSTVFMSEIDFVINYVMHDILYAIIKKTKLAGMEDKRSLTQSLIREKEHHIAKR